MPELSKPGTPVQQATDRLEHELLAVISRISQAALMPDSVVRGMPRAYEIFGGKAKLRLWESVQGALPYEHQLNGLIRGVCSSLRQLKCTVEHTTPAPDTNEHYDQGARVIRFRMFDLVFTMTIVVTSYEVTGEHGGGTAIVGLYIGVLEQKLP